MFYFSGPKSKAFILSDNHLKGKDSAEK